MTFAHPFWLVIGVVLAAAFLGLAHLASRRASKAALAYSDIDFFVGATRPRFDPALPLALACGLGIAILGAALAGPRLTVPVPLHGAVVLCVDTSGSMRSTDVVPTRAAAAAAAVRAFIDGVPNGTRIGIVAFSSAAGVVQPLTEDKDVARAAIAQIPPPNGGTAIGDALAAAARTLPRTGKRAIVLVTDGVNNLGVDPLTVAQQAGNAGIQIDTVGIGTNDSGELVPGTIEPATIDENALREIAQDAHGGYARANDAEGLRGRLAALAATTTTERRRIDASLPLALAGGVIVVFALGGGMLAGRFP